MYKLKNSLITFGGMLILIGATAFVASTAGQARVDSNEVGQSGPPIVGLWKVVVTQNGTEILRGFDIYNRDRTEVLAEFHDPRTGNVCLGVWSKSGPRTYKLLHPAFRWNHLLDESMIQPPLLNQSWTGYRIVSEEVTVDPSGDSFSGTFTVRRFSTTGVFQGQTDARISGERITADTPEANLF
jgi:hypothetical protein